MQVYATATDLTREFIPAAPEYCQTFSLMSHLCGGALLGSGNAFLNSACSKRWSHDQCLKLGGVIIAFVSGFCLSHDQLRDWTTFFHPLDVDFLQLLRSHKGAAESNQTLEEGGLPPRKRRYLLPTTTRGVARTIIQLQFQ